MPPKAEAALAERGALVPPDFIADAGAVIVPPSNTGAAAKPRHSPPLTK